MSAKEETVVGARDLLELYLDFRRMTSNKASWNEESLASNPPRLVRFQRLTALFKAIGIETKVSSFHRGEFIDANSPAFLPLLARMRTDVDDELIAEHWDLESYRTSVDLRWLFKRLLKYRIRLDRVLNFDNGVLVASGIFYYACQKVGETNRAIKPHVRIVDDLLVALISPTDQKFYMTELAHAFGYPLVDLWDIDADWI